MADIAGTVSLADESGFAVGDVLGRSLTVFRTGFVKFVLLTGLFLLPDLIASLFFPDLGPGTKRSPSASGWMFVVTILQVLASVAVIAVALGRINGREIGILEAIQESGRRFRPALFTSILQGFAIVLGFLLLIVPGVIATAMMYVAMPACVAEGMGATASINRSAALTKGNRWKVLGIALVANVGGLVVLAVALVLATSFSGQRGLAIATYLLQVVYLAFTTVVSTVVYQALRTAKEGPALETLAEVFA